MPLFSEDRNSECSSSLFLRELHKLCVTTFVATVIQVRETPRMDLNLLDFPQILAYLSHLALFHDSARFFQLSRTARRSFSGHSL